MSKQVKIEAQKAALDLGFSSLQETVRILLRKLAQKELTISVEEKPVQLSARAEKRYSKITEDFKRDRNIHHAKDVDDLIHQLNEV